MYQIDFYCVEANDFDSWFEVYETVGSFATLEEAWQVANKLDTGPYKIRFDSNLTARSD